MSFASKIWILNSVGPLPKISTTPEIALAFIHPRTVISWTVIQNSFSPGEGSSRNLADPLFHR